LHALTDSAFMDELGQAFGSRVGRFTGVTQRSLYPLGLNARPATSNRTVAIGNAAQTLHPVAGQGLNLGLRDAAVLARLLAEDTSAAMLDRFAASRQTDRSLTIRLTDTMARIFSGTAPPQALLGLTLGLIDAFRPAKRLLAEQMMFGQR
jgi:2-octaprenyl-6-methoxyphenol hydroxylase